MKPVEKMIVTDAQNRPVAVQIKYSDWLEIERTLGAAHTNGASNVDLSRFAGTLKLPGDPAEYQQRSRDEWR
ncbi:MAG: hypothetical protein KF699_02315 [Phycisphaeraceae bacterium]|nr:hypothetical protein [Phycisphaeraceae bacterium]MBX3407547.1 hypothetical protein [Phycisphaeraceae bacterium]